MASDIKLLLLLSVQAPMGDSEEHRQSQFELTLDPRW
jgi:hypothetical protein